MTVIGVLLIVLAVLFLVLVLFGGSDEPVVFGFGIGELNLDATQIFLLGAATVLIFVSGLELLRTGLRRSIARRRELKKARAVLTQHEQGEQQQGEQQQSEHGSGAEPAAGQLAAGESTASPAPGTTSHGAPPGGSQPPPAGPHHARGSTP